MRWTRVALRSAAVAIALLGAVDPAITTTRRGRPEVALLAHSASSDSLLANAIRAQLGDAFRVVTAPLATAAATIVVGDQLPDPRWNVQGSLVAVVPDGDAARVDVASFTLPAEISLDGATSVEARVRVRAASGKLLRLRLRDGDRLVSESAHAIGTRDTLLAVPIAYAPVAAGRAVLRFSASVDGVSDDVTRYADAVVHVRADPWQVFTYDARPAWQATFVRRALERDARFVVTGRSLTSRGVSIGRGAPPADLTDASALAPFQAVIVGAPEQLTLAEVRGVERYLRGRAGRVVLLAETNADAPYRQLLGSGGWQHDSGGRPVKTSPADAGLGALQGASLVWPDRLPVGAEVIATAMVRGVARPVIWRTSVGSGELLFIGVADAWQSRDPEDSDFERFWRSVVADLVASAPPAVQVVLDRSSVAPNESTSIEVTLRDLALQPADLGAVASATAFVESASGVRRMLRLWPDWSRGTLRGLTPPMPKGEYRVVVAYQGDRAEVPLQVASGVATPEPSSEDLHAAWVVGKGGAVLPAQDLSQLSELLRRIMQVAGRPERWHPMRSPWWIVPFAALLSLEWWLRRREGER